MRTLCCDVGSSSVRVAIFEVSDENLLNVEPLSFATENIPIHNKQEDYYEQKTTEVWSAFLVCAKKCLEDIKLKFNLLDPPSLIDSIGFSATCSLVIIDGIFEKDQNDYGDIIMWMDHRAKVEAEIINETNHDVLKQFGGSCSTEFSLSKLLHLYRNNRNRFDQAKGFMELPDWLSYRCSQMFGMPENFPRSLCCVTCKWGYDSEKNQWPEDFFEKIGMPLTNSLKRLIGDKILRPGLCSGYLGSHCAQELEINLNNSSKTISIASSLIDAHSGVISMLSTFASNDDMVDGFYENILCMISGTSTCHMILNKKRFSTKGIWGPYFDAIFPGYYLREAGQSATGNLIEIMLKTKIEKSVTHVYNLIQNLNQQLQEFDFSYQTKLIINPTFHGNRSPIADSRLKGAIYGLKLEQSSFLETYVATIEALAYETKFILEEIEKNSDQVKRIIVSGGLTKNEFYLQLHADILCREILTFDTGEASHMLLGASLIAITASKIHTDENNCVSQLENQLRKVRMTKNKVRIFKPRLMNNQYHCKKYQCYRKLLDCCLQIENILGHQSK